MTKLLLKLPWFLSAPAVVALAAVLAIGANLLLSEYFERSRADEADPFSAPAVEAGGEPSPRATQPAAAPTRGDAEPSATPAASNEPVILYRGEWQDGDPGHSGEGRAIVGRDASGMLVLRVEDFSVTNGPDLVVALSPEPDAYGDGSLILGDLKATDGNFNYEIPEGTDLSQFQSVVVWCRRFPTTFAYATLEEA